MKENDLPRDVIYLAEPPFAGSEGRRDNHTNNEFAERYNRSIDGNAGAADRPSQRIAYIPMITAKSAIA
jgi:hypothetical protein